MAEEEAMAEAMAHVRASLKAKSEPPGSETGKVPVQSEAGRRKELADTQAEMDAAFASGDYVAAAGLADTLADLQRAQPPKVGRAACQSLVDEWGSHGLAEP